jgi:septum site-determining protein MinD
MGEAIVITSGKGGVGKTTATAGLGAALALEGRSVALVDADIGLRNLDLALGLENRIVYDLLDVVAGTCVLRQALIRDSRYPGLCLLPAAQTRDKAAVSPAQMADIVGKLKEEFDYVLVDCPAGIEQGFRNAVAGADRAVVVTAPEVAAVRDASRVKELLDALGLPIAGMILNRFRPKMAKRGDIMGVDDAVDILSMELLGVVPEDDAVARRGNLGEPLAEGRAPAAEAFRRIAKRLAGASPAENRGLAGFLRGLFGAKPAGEKSGAAV